MAKDNARKRVKFEFEATPECDVCVAGTFNDWDSEGRRLKFRQSNRKHSICILLEKGKKFEYKFIVNGNWCLDPNSNDVVSNEFGSMNSVVLT